jgi:hypothetical protein
MHDGGGQLALARFRAAARPRIAVTVPDDLEKRY